jgi:hypothetical protein
VRSCSARNKFLRATPWRRTYDLSYFAWGKIRVVEPKLDERVTLRPDRKGRVLAWYSVVKEVGTLTH